jgi:hypothetical protein
MKRKWVLLIAVAALLLGIAAGIGIPPLLRPPPAEFVMDELDAARLLEQSKPAGAKFIIPPDLVSQRGESSYHATTFTAWEGPTDARKVVVNLEKELRRFITGKRGNYGGQHQGGSTPFDEKGVSTFIREYSEFHFPERGLSGLVYIALSCGEGQKCCVTLTLYVGQKKRD